MIRTNSNYSIVFTVPKDYDGKNIKLFLRKECGVSARMLSRLKIYENGIMKNGVHAIVTDCINTNDEITLNFAKEKNELTPIKMDVNILYEDESIIVFDKPSGLTVHPVRDYVDNTLANFAAYHCMECGESYIFRASNRLDKDTSGCVICAKNAFVAELLKDGVKKRYLAIVSGRIEAPGTVDAPIRLKENSFMVREAGFPDGKRAITHYTPIFSSSNLTLISLTLETGRTHQIRAHMAYIGHPLIGDDLYGGSTYLMSRQALHCASADISLRTIGKRININSPLPQDFNDVLSKYKVQI